MTGVHCEQPGLFLDFLPVFVAVHTFTLSLCLLHLFQQCRRIRASSTKSSPKDLYIHHRHSQDHSSVNSSHRASNELDRYYVMFVVLQMIMIPLRLATQWLESGTLRKGSLKRHVYLALYSLVSGVLLLWMTILLTAEHRRARIVFKDTRHEIPLRSQRIHLGLLFAFLIFAAMFPISDRIWKNEPIILITSSTAALMCWLTSFVWISLQFSRRLTSMVGQNQARLQRISQSATVKTKTHTMSSHTRTNRAKNGKMKVDNKLNRSHHSRNDENNHNNDTHMTKTDDTGTMKLSWKNKRKEHSMNNDAVKSGDTDENENEDDHHHHHSPEHRALTLTNTHSSNRPFHGRLPPTSDTNSNPCSSKVTPTPSHQASHHLNVSFDLDGLSPEPSVSELADDIESMTFVNVVAKQTLLSFWVAMSAVLYLSSYLMWSLSHCSVWTVAGYAIEGLVWAMVSLRLVLGEPVNKEAYQYCCGRCDIHILHLSVDLAVWQSQSHNQP